jgi:hypothetical protein
MRTNISGAVSPLCHSERSRGISHPKNLHVSDAGSYAPVTILIDERPDGVHLSYDRMASLLAPYENAEALKVAKHLDAKVEGLIASAAW